MRSNLITNFSLRTVQTLGVCMLLCSCGSTKTTGSTIISEDGRETRTVQIEETPEGTVTTSTSKVIEPRGDSVIYNQHEAGSGLILTESNPDHFNDGTPNHTHVNVPGLKLDSDESSQSIHIKAPFVSINKNGPGDKMRIRLPFVRINTDD